MLAAATTTTDLVLGIVALVIGIAVLVVVIYLVYRLLTWPFRGRRSRTKGLGSDYEEMVRQQRGKPARMTSRPLPFPSPSGEWETPEPATMPESKAVLPPPPYRAREAEPATEPVASPMAAPEPTPPPSTWERLMRTPVRLPAWVGMPLVFLGLIFVFFKPLGLDWFMYGAALVSAVALGVWTKLRYQSKTLWRGARSIVVWVRWGPRDDAVPPPVVVEATAGGSAEPGSAAVIRTPDKLDHLREQQLITSDEYDRLRAPKDDGSPPSSAPTNKTCPDCAETVLAGARVCRYCGYRFDQAPDAGSSVQAP